MNKSNALTRLCGKTTLHFKRGAPTILTCLSAAGVILTAISAVRATPKAVALIEADSMQKHDDPHAYTKTEAICSAWQCYIPSLVIGLSTIACLFGANALNMRNQASLASAYALLDSSYKDYKNKVETLYGDDADDRVQEEIAKDNYAGGGISAEDPKQLFYDVMSRRYFECTREELIWAEYELNRLFVLMGYATLNNFYKILDLPELPETDAGNVLDWSIYAGEEFYGYKWIDFEYKKAVMDDGLECYIVSMPFPPTADYENF